MGTVREFVYKELDEEGKDTLEVLSGADRLNKWMVDSIKPYLHGNILEIGSGIGNISQILLDQGHKLTLTDIRAQYCEELRSRFGNRKNLQNVLNVDLVDEEFDSLYVKMHGQYDTIFALNVVEHIRDDFKAVENVRKLLKPGGRFIMLVPAYERIYNRFDKELFHFRRYNTRTATKLFRNADYNIEKSYYFNAAGILGWVVSGQIMKHKTIPKSEISLFNNLVPAFRLLDKVLLNKVGLSVVVVGKK